MKLLFICHSGFIFKREKHLQLIYNYLKYNYSAMGIIGLQSFIKNNCSNALEHVNLANIAEVYRKEMRKDPVMIIDIASCINFFIQSNTNTRYMLGELKQFRKNVEIFNKKLFELGIKPVVVIDGMKTILKKNIWKKNTKKSVVDFERAYNEALSNFNVSSANNARGIYIEIALQVFLSSGKCKVWRAFYEADFDIIAFAKKHDCFAILSNDSDFLISEGARYLLSGEHFNMESMTTYNYNRNKFAEYLGISPSVLPLYAALCFHSHLDSKLLFSFYDVNNIDKKNRLIEVAEFLRNFSSGEKKIENLLKTKYFLGIDKKKLLERIEYFNGYCMEKGLPFTEFTNWNNILFLAKKKFENLQANKQILPLLVNQSIYLMGNYLNYKPSPELLFLRKKIYGILFFECPFSKLYITEYIFKTCREGSSAKYCVAKVSFFRRFHLGLLDLWSSDNSKLNRISKLKVFCQAIHEDLRPFELESQNLPDELLFPLFSVFLLRWESIRKISWEDAKTILIQAVVVYKSTCEDIASYPDVIHVDAIDLKNWFLETVYHLDILNSSCGNPFSDKVTSPINFFDGKVFHDVWNKINNTEHVLKTFGQEMNSLFEDLISTLFSWELICGYVCQENLIPKKPKI